MYYMDASFCTLRFYNFATALCSGGEQYFWSLGACWGWGVGVGANLDSERLYPLKTGCTCCVLQRSPCTQVCSSLPEWRYFLDRMLWASWLSIKIAAVKERDKISTL